MEENNVQINTEIKKKEFHKKKKVLITGENSYIGKSFEDYAKKNYPDNFDIDTISMHGDLWKNVDFSVYDAVFHVAGIAHSDTGKASDETKKKYYAVNTELAFETAKKAKFAGVCQFVLMSSMIIYGNSAPLGQEKIITGDTLPEPANFYGDSKFQADKKVRSLADDSFKTAVIRSPMVYGRGSKGNYPILAKAAKKLPFFPNVKNCRSMIYIGNLCEFICKLILLGEGGIFFPQNGEYTQTSQMTAEIASVTGKKLHLTKFFAPFLYIASKMPGKIGSLVNKAFGNMAYDMSISEYDKIEYRIADLKTSIALTEGKEQLEKPKALMLASVASMIDLFNADNINILIGRGFQVDVAANFDNGSITSGERVSQYREELEERGIGVYNIPIPRSITKIKDMIVSYSMIKKTVNSGKYDIVHCHSPIGGVLCRLACRSARKKYGTKVIYTAHGFHFFDGAGKGAWLVFYPIEKFCSRFTDVLITINNEDFNRARTFHAAKVKYVPGIGVHTDEIRNTEIDRDAKRAELGYSSDDFVFMSTGQISVRKNHEIVLRALSKISDKRVKYMIVGFGELEDKLKALAKELGIEKRVKFAGYHSDVVELLYAADAFAFPSLQEGLPVGLMEAMAAGLPIVCSEIRGNTDLISNGKGGYLNDCHDADGFAESMMKIVKNKSRRMGRINIKTMNRFDAAAVNGMMDKIYREAAGQINNKKDGKQR